MSGEKHITGMRDALDRQVPTYTGGVNIARRF